MTDCRAVAARGHHVDAQEALHRADGHREQRDRLIRELRAEDPQHWSFARLALAVGCEPELIAQILRGTGSARGRKSV